MGITLGAPVSKGKKGASKRLSDEQKATLRSAILSAVKSGGKDGAKKALINEAVIQAGLSIGEQSLSGYVKDLIAQKVLSQEGTARATTYHAVL